MSVSAEADLSVRGVFDIALGLDAMQVDVAVSALPRRASFTTLLTTILTCVAPSAGGAAESWINAGIVFIAFTHHTISVPPRFISSFTLFDRAATPPSISIIGIGGVANPIKILPWAMS